MTLTQVIQSLWLLGINLIWWFSGNQSHFFNFNPITEFRKQHLIPCEDIKKGKIIVTSLAKVPQEAPFISPLPFCFFSNYSCAVSSSFFFLFAFILQLLKSWLDRLMHSITLNNVSSCLMDPISESPNQLPPSLLLHLSHSWCYSQNGGGAANFQPPLLTGRWERESLLVLAPPKHVPPIKSAMGARF